MGCSFTMFDCALCLRREQPVDDSAIWFSDLAALEVTEASPPEKAAVTDSPALPPEEAAAVAAVTTPPARPSEQAAMADAGKRAAASPLAVAAVADARRHTPPARRVRRVRAAEGRRVTFAPNLEIVFPIPKLLGPFVLIQVVEELTETDDAGMDYLSFIPTPLLIKILSLLDKKSLLCASMTCRKLAHVCRRQPPLRKRIEKQIAREMAHVEEDSRECNQLWSHVIYMWEARCPFLFQYRRHLNDLNKEVLNDLNKYTVDNLARATIPKKMNIPLEKI